jgi:hypothetical protein
MLALLRKRPEGRISPETFEEWNRETGGKKWPEHVKTKRRKSSVPKRRTIKRK